MLRSSTYRKDCGCVGWKSWMHKPRYMWNSVAGKRGGHTNRAVGYLLNITRWIDSWTLDTRACETTNSRILFVLQMFHLPALASDLMYSERITILSIGATDLWGKAIWEELVNLIHLLNCLFLLYPRRVIRCIHHFLPLRFISMYLLTAGQQSSIDAFALILFLSYQNVEALGNEQ